MENKSRLEKLKFVYCDDLGQVTKLVLSQDIEFGEYQLDFLINGFKNFLKSAGFNQTIVDSIEYKESFDVPDDDGISEIEK